MPRDAPGDVAVEGGWRIYSSGPGLALRLVTEVLLGLRPRGDDAEIDPALPPSGDAGAGASEVTARLPLGQSEGHAARLHRRRARRPVSAGSP